MYKRQEKALIEFRTDKRKKTVIVHAQPEALIGIGRVVTPVSTMLEHVLMSRLNDMSEGRLETGMLKMCIRDRPGTEWEKTAKERLHFHDMQPERVAYR